MLISIGSPESGPVFHEKKSGCLGGKLRMPALCVVEGVVRRHRIL